ncbi:MAG: dicarboxylate/amino acid:cation symporter [Rickettsiales bacterium]|nr:dicarboxylate/amino acid:cation symporter [Rickettsiales bacterium]
MFRKMPFILIIMVIDLPVELKQILYSISISIKSFIVMMLPIIIFFLLFKAVITLSGKASKIIGITLLLVCCSNFFSTFLSHYVGAWIYNFDFAIVLPKESTGLNVLWSLNLPNLIANDKAMFSGIVIGLIMSKFYLKQAKLISARIEVYIQKLLNGFIYLIPLFVAGFVAKLQADGVMHLIVRDYALIVFIIACVQFGYILLSYFILNKFKLKKSLSSIINMIPAAISGFSTMSSAASMPLSIIGTENNVKEKDLARSIIPAIVNIHLVGDCFAIPIFAYAVLKTFGMPEPDLWHYLIFTFYFVIAKFSVAAIPGGGIIVMLPILKAYLGFNAEMMSLITALYILFDPIITCGNVLGNGAFVQLIDKFVSAKKH